MGLLIVICTNCPKSKSLLFTMMLGRIARSFAAPGLRSNAAILAPKAPAMVARRNFAVPSTLSVRMDGLLTQCVIAALIHFVPQDAIILGGALFMAHSAASAKSPKGKAASDEAVEAFEQQKGLDEVKYRNGCVSL